MSCNSDGRACQKTGARLGQPDTELLQMQARATPHCEMCGAFKSPVGLCQRCMNAAPDLLRYTQLGGTETPSEYQRVYGFNPLTGEGLREMYSRYASNVSGKEREVIFDPGVQTAGTDLSGKIYVNPMPVPTPLSQQEPTVNEQMAVVLGLMEHEILHELYTPGTSLDEMRRVGAELAQPETFEEILNILEDARIERIAQKRHPFVWQRIQSVHQYLPKHDNVQPEIFARLPAKHQIVISMLCDAQPGYALTPEMWAACKPQVQAVLREVLPLAQQSVLGDADTCLRNSRAIYDAIEQRGLLEANNTRQGGSVLDDVGGRQSQPHSGGQSADGQAAAGEHCPRCGGFLRSDGYCPKCGGAGGDDTGAAGASGASGDDTGAAGASGAGGDDTGAAGASGASGDDTGAAGASGASGDDSGAAGASGASGDDTGAAGASGAGNVGGRGVADRLDSPPELLNQVADRISADTELSPDILAETQSLLNRAVHKTLDGVTQRIGKQINRGLSPTEQVVLRRPAKESQLPLYAQMSRVSDGPPQSRDRIGRRSPTLRPKSVDAAIQVGRSLGRRLAQLKTQAVATKRLQKRGTLDRSRFVAGMKGSDRVYQQPGSQRGTSIAVSMLFDVSGSMENDLYTLKEAVLATSVGLTDADIPFDVMGFSNSLEGHVRQVKSFAEHGSGKRLLDCAEKITDHWGGGTPTAEAVYVSGVSLQARSEVHKIQFIFTDGAPNDYSAAQRELRSNQANGIQPIGIILGKSISDQWAEELFGKGKYVRLDNLADFPQTIEQVLGDVIRETEKQR